MKAIRQQRSGPVGAMLVLCALALAGSVRSSKADDLYGSRGVVPDAVVQGKLGSCYFHAVIAALAQHHQSEIRKLIQPNPNGSYTVTFGDGKKETAYADDIKYTRDSGYDLSEGQWVAVLFRAYAQRVLRESLVQATEASDIFPFLKQPLEQLEAASDPLVLAYDRAIRAQVDQYGNIDRAQLESRLKSELDAVSVPDSMKNSVISTLESGGFFDKLASMVQQNGELFGAYRAVGQGGMADRVMQTFAGSTRFQENQSPPQAGSALNEAVSKGVPIVACTGGSEFYQQVSRGQTLPAGTDAWYVNAHCYTVLSFDPQTSTVSLRNPWARHPEPGGLFQLPLATFLPAYYGIVTSE